MLVSPASTFGERAAAPSPVSTEMQRVPRQCSYRVCCIDFTRTYDEINATNIPASVVMIQGGEGILHVYDPFIGQADRKTQNTDPVQFAKQNKGTLSYLMHPGGERAVVDAKDIQLLNQQLLQIRPLYDENFMLCEKKETNWNWDAEMFKFGTYANECKERIASLCLTQLKGQYLIWKDAAEFEGDHVFVDVKLTFDSERQTNRSSFPACVTRRPNETSTSGVPGTQGSPAATFLCALSPTRVMKRKINETNDLAEQSNFMLQRHPSDRGSSSSLREY